METNRLQYMSPLSSRYASKEMKYIFSEKKKFTTWHELWIALAKAEKELGLDITDEQIQEMIDNKDIVDFEVAEAREKEVRHDVMSHVYAYGKRCPKAEAIIHLGATSCYVGDNTDVILMKEALELIIEKTVQVLVNLKKFSREYKAMPCLGYTHLQPAQLTTVGKRASLWMYELALDVIELERRLEDLKMLGSKGTTGTQASFMEEPFEKNQIGSSAMPYKRNPMRSERITSLARYVIVDSLNPAITAATQWFERTLDDSANKRISVPEAFLALDGILNLYINITSDMVVYPKVINARTMEKLPFIATENIMMEAVKKGGNRQDLHEQIRVHSHEATLRVKRDGLNNDLVDRIAADKTFGLSKEEILSAMDPILYVGRSPSQVEELITEVIDPIIERHPQKNIETEINL